jgi:hypothetical protein
MKRGHTILAAVLALVSYAGLAAAKPPFWDDQINKPGRFKILKKFDGAAVFDKETGLVWEQSPDSDQDPDDRKMWGDAGVFCNNRVVGGRRGWRLPTNQELASLVDPSQSSPALPPGHPFANVQSSEYWSATTDADDPGEAWRVSIDDGQVDRGNKTNDNHFAWCVRGGQGADAQ